MDEFYNPIRRVDPFEESKTRVPPAQPGKHTKEDPAPLPKDPIQHQKMIYGSIVLFYKKLFNTMFFTRRDGGTRTINEIAVAAEKFRNELSKLKATDDTDNPHYTEVLSDLWETLLAAPPNSPLAPFLKLANEYPFGDAHSLGFYLSQHAGDEWLPFPFLEILKKLHQGYVLRKHHSELSHLLNLLDQALLQLGI